MAKPVIHVVEGDLSLFGSICLHPPDLHETGSGSIIYAVLNNKRPIPEKYGISDNEFYSVYVDYLVKRNLLATFVEDGVTYFRSTPESKKFEGFARVKIQKIVWGLVQTAIALAQLAV